MSVTDDLKGVNLSPKLVSFMLGLLSLASAFWYSVSYLQGQENRSLALETRINSIENRMVQRDADNKEDYKNLITKIDSLQGEVMKLTISLNGVQIRQEGASRP